jgi:hypothetical protein
MSVFGGFGGFAARSASNEDSGKIIPTDAACVLSGPSLTKNCNSSQMTSSSTLVLKEPPRGVVSGDVGRETSSGIHMGGTFQTQTGTTVPYSPPVYFGNTGVEGAIRIAGTKDPGDLSSETFLITQVKRETAPNAFDWVNIAVVDDSQTTDPF